jgi:hypothetical protein
VARVDHRADEDHLPQITPEELEEMKGLNRKPQANPKEF